MEASMRSRLDELPRYSSRSCLMAAATYNRIRLALLRLGSPLRLPLTGLRTLEMVLEKDAWVCVDASLNDHPIWPGCSSRSPTARRCTSPSSVGYSRTMPTPN